MSIPAVLMARGIVNENQDTTLTTVKLTPAATSNFQTRFEIPPNGHMLDSNSALVWSLSYREYSAAELDHLILLKNFSGGLNSILRARFYIGSRLIFENNDGGHSIHIKNLSRNPDYLEEVLDLQIGSVHGFFDTTAGKIQLGQSTVSRSATDINGNDGIKTYYNRYSRSLGSYSASAASNRAIECSVLLSDLFPALQSMQLPLDIPKMRVEIDWETSFNELAYIACDVTNNLTAADLHIDIQNPLLLLDFLSFTPEANDALKMQLTNGVVIPYIHQSISTKNIAANTSASSITTDIQVSLQSKLLMRMVVSHRNADTSTAAPTVPLAPQKGNGRCRSERGLNMSFNCYVNNISLYDLPVDTSSMQYSYFSETQGGDASVVPGSVAYNPLVDTDAAAATDINSAVYVPCGVSLPQTHGITGPEVRNMVSNCTSYIGFDFSLLPEGSGSRGGRVIATDSGYRNGSTPLIIRITQSGSVANGGDNPTASAKLVEIFTEEIKTLQIRNNMVEIFDA